MKTLNCINVTFSNHDSAEGILLCSYVDWRNDLQLIATDSIGWVICVGITILYMKNLKSHYDMYNI